MINFEIFIFVINQQFSNRKINWSACSGVKKFLFSVITLLAALNRCCDGTLVATNLSELFIMSWIVKCAIRNFEYLKY